MGVDLRILISRESLRRMLDRYDYDLLWRLFLWQGIRWYRFKNRFDLDEFIYPSGDAPISSKELLKHLARHRLKLSERIRAFIADLSEYDIIFYPDDQDVEKQGYLEVDDLMLICKEALKNA